MSSDLLPYSLGMFFQVLALVASIYTAYVVVQFDMQGEDRHVGAGMLAGIVGIGAGVSMCLLESLANPLSPSAQVILNDVHTLLCFGICMLLCSLAQFVKRRGGL